MKKNKKSHIIVGIFILFGAIMTVGYSFQINDNLKKIPPAKSSVWLLGKGEYFLDTVHSQFNHLVTDFPLLELLPRLNNLVEIEGYQNSRRFLTVKNKSDTLFVTQTFPNSDTVLVAVEGDYPIVVRVGAASLKSITVNSNGRIDVPVNPYGSNPGDEIVYRPEHWEKYVIRNDTLDLTLNGNAEAELFLESKHVDIAINNNRQRHFPNYRCTSLIGSVNSIALSNPYGDVCINGKYLQADSLFVRSDTNPNARDFGFIELKCKEYIEADLRFDLNVAYRGNPKIKKKERGFGRIINSNQ